MSTQSSPRRAHVVSLLAIVASACGGGLPTDPLSPRALAGAYTLRTVGGAPLPLEVIPGLSQLVAEEIRLGADGTYSRRTSFVGTQFGRRGDAEEGGEWFVRDSAVYLRVPDPRISLRYSAAERNTLTAEDVRGLLVYRRK